MRMPLFQMMSALVACLALPACGPTELNDNQRAYLRDLALEVTAETHLLAVDAMLLGHLLEGVVFEPGASPSAHVARALERIERLPGCSFGTVLHVDGADGIWLDRGTCTLGGRDFAFGADLRFANGVNGPEVLINAVKVEGLHSYGDLGGVTLTYGAGGARTLRADSDVALFRSLSFEGPLDYDPETFEVSLTGAGAWGGRIGEDPVALRFHDVAFAPLACLAHAGTMDVGPLEVRLTSEQSTPVTSEVRWSASDRVAIEIEGETVQSPVPGVVCL